MISDNFKFEKSFNKIQGGKLQKLHNEFKEKLMEITELSKKNQQ